MKGDSIERLPYLARTLGHLRILEMRDTLSPRRDFAVDAARFAELGMRSLLVCGLSLNGRVHGFMALCSAQPRDGWDANLHLLLKLVGASFATGLERLRVARHVARLEERYALSLPSANDGLWDFDVENNTVYFSPRWRKMLGFDEHDPHVSPDWRRLVHPDEMARVQMMIRDHIAGKTPMFESVHRMRHCNGDWRWVISRAKARIDGTGRLRRLVGVEADITERKLYEDALFKEKESAQITLQSIGDGVITTDQHLTIEYLNPVAEDLTGWRFEEAQGKNIDDIFRGFHEETCEPLENPLSVAIRRSRAIKSVRPTLLIKRDGNEMYIESTASPIRDGSGAVSGGVLVFHDVSESRELNRKLSYHASHDILTGLVNRREFESRLERSLQERAGTRGLVRALPPRRGPVQDHQRHLRPQRRRRAARAGRRAAEDQDPLARHAGAPRRRRVRRAARELHARGRAAHGRPAARDDPQLQVRLGGAHVPPRLQRRRRADHRRQRGRGGAAVGGRQRLRGSQGGGPQPRLQLPGKRHRPDASPARDAVGRAHQQRARGVALRAVPDDHPAAAEGRTRGRTTSCCSG